MKSILIFCYFLNLSFALALETREPGQQVVTSFSVLADILRNLLPSDIEVKSLVPAGSDIHGFQIMAKDYIALKKARHLIVVGNEFDQWAVTAAQKAGSQASVYAISTRIKLLPASSDHPHEHSEDHDPHSSHETTDPHFWLSPQVSLKVIDELTAYLKTSFPEKKEEIESLKKVYSSSIKTLAEQYKREFAQVFVEKRQMIVAHNSFQYFAQEFNVKVDSPLDVAQNGESSVKKISSLVKKIKTEKIKSLFLEKSTPDSSMKALSQETKTPLAGTLYSDCLSTDDKASTYLKLLKFNFDQILQSMKGP